MHAEFTYQRSEQVKTTLFLLDDHVVAIVSQPIAAGARLCSNLSILPKVCPTDDVPMKQEAKSNSTSTPPCMDDVRVKQEPIESEEEQQTDFSIPTVKAEPPLSMIDSPKSKETKKLHRTIAPLMSTHAWIISSL